MDRDRIQALTNEVTECNQEIVLLKQEKEALGQKLALMDALHESTLIRVQFLEKDVKRLERQARAHQVIR